MGSNLPSGCMRFSVINLTLNHSATLSTLTLERTHCHGKTGLAQAVEMVWGR